MTKPYQKCTLSLTAEETLTLKQLALNHRHVDFQRKAAGLLQLAQGTRPKEIARELDVTQQSVYLWLGAWRERGLVGLMGGHAGGASSRVAHRDAGYRRGHCPSRSAILASLGQGGRSDASLPPSVLLGDPR
jgi:hypothetical protein